MKRFLLFAGETYYPRGGWADFQSSADTLDEAVEKAANVADCDWWQIVDTQNMEVVKRGRRH